MNPIEFAFTSLERQSTPISFMQRQNVVVLDCNHSSPVPPVARKSHYPNEDQNVGWL